MHPQQKSEQKNSRKGRIGGSRLHYDNDTFWGSKGCVMTDNVLHQ